MFLHLWIGYPGPVDVHRRAFLNTATVGLGAAIASAQQQPGSNNPAFSSQYAGPPAGHHVPEPPPPEHPNIIWVLGDQLRAQALSFNGDPNARTPNLDRAEVNGTNLTANLSGFPLCCPFRGSMLTGRYAHHCVPGHEFPLPKMPVHVDGLSCPFFGSHFKDIAGHW